VVHGNIGGSCVARSLDLHSFFGMAGSNNNINVVQCPQCLLGLQKAMLLKFSMRSTIILMIYVYVKMIHAVLVRFHDNMYGWGVARATFCNVHTVFAFEPDPMDAYLVVQLS
jgi:hypothetical protein